MWQQLLVELQQGNTRSLARCISLIENEAEGYEQLMKSLQLDHSSKVIGITGPPGAGKSTLVDSLTGELVSGNYRVGILCVDPSSPFNFGALLGDRIRMSDWYNHPNVFIRSLATRGALGGLHPKIIEITDLLKQANFDYIIVETVGVGQSEVEIAGLADTTVVVLVPEGGDEIQTMKAGLMEIADIFVVNKSDRPGADRFVHNLNLMLSPSIKKEHAEIPIIKTVASEKTGIHELVSSIQKSLAEQKGNDKKYWLLTEQAFHLIQNKKMKNISKNKLKEMIEKSMQQGDFNMYHFIEQHI
ncbi:MAG: methylmalonyl Co-A mutase-associated GTPase MeaB [Chitinophagaceae bacterium]|nr:methylmalonyl Co-A mutase-associated GTPase MeaB [Chitinophagaceae bacterium]